MLGYPDGHQKYPNNYMDRQDAKSYLSQDGQRGKYNYAGFINQEGNVDSQNAYGDFASNYADQSNDVAIGYNSGVAVEASERGRKMLGYPVDQDARSYLSQHGQSGVYNYAGFVNQQGNVDSQNAYGKFASNYAHQSNNAAIGYNGGVAVDASFEG